MRDPFLGVVALDGPSGTGKSTVARRLAEALGARYLDTGAMYRAMTVAVLDAGVDLDNGGAIDTTTSSVELWISLKFVNQASQLTALMSASRSKMTWDRR